jgi:chemotaxis protein CheD
MITFTRGSVSRIHIIEGEFLVANAPDVVLTTVLGSCVAACLFDPVARIGGMNHFLLPGDSDIAHIAEANRTGVRLMEMLLTELLTRGAQRQRITGKLFGGACMPGGGGREIGAKNANFAKRFLEKERICVVANDLGGAKARRIEYFPESGRARQTLIQSKESAPRALA